MSHENSVLWQKIATDISKSISDKLKARELEWGKDHISFTVNGGKKKVKLTIKIE